MSDWFCNTRATLRALFADTLTARPDREAMASIAKLEEVIEKRTQATGLASTAHRIARDL